MIRLENVLKISLQDVFARYLEDIFARRLDDVLANFVMMPWRRLEDVFKTSLRRLEDVLKAYGQDEYIGLDQDVFWRHMTKANLFVLIKTSWKRLEDVFWRRRRQASSRLSSRRFHQDECLVRISVIVHKNNITKTDDQQFPRELFRSCLHDPDQKRNTSGFQTFDTGRFLLSLQRTTENIRKALKIILLHSLTLSCRVVTKEHTYLSKPAAEICRFV